jgi:hypothetical protein
MDPGWDPQNEADEWARHHFIHLTIEGLKRARVKPLNYSQVTTVQQGPDESPMAFLKHLKEIITKHTTVDPELVREVLLRDKFLTQSAPNICRKLQKLVAEDDKMLDQLVQMATSVYYNRDLTKKREKNKRHHDLVAALREFPPNGDLMSGHATIVDKRDTSNESVHKDGSLGDSPDPLQDPALSERAITGSHTVPVSI